MLLHSPCSGCFMPAAGCVREAGKAVGLPLAQCVSCRLHCRLHHRFHHRIHCRFHAAVKGRCPFWSSCARDQKKYFRFPQWLPQNSRNKPLRAGQKRLFTVSALCFCRLLAWRVCMRSSSVLQSRASVRGRLPSLPSRKERAAGQQTGCLNRMRPGMVSVFFGFMKVCTGLSAAPLQRLPEAFSAA